MHTYLEKTFDEHEIDVEVYHTVNGKVPTRQFSKKHTAYIEEFIESLVYKIDNLTTHSFIAKRQSRYLKRRKIEELNEYLLSMKFDSYYDDNFLQPEVGESVAAHP